MNVHIHCSTEPHTEETAKEEQFYKLKMKKPARKQSKKKPDL